MAETAGVDFWFQEVKARNTTKNLKFKRKGIARDKKFGGTNPVIKRRIRKTGDNFLTNWAAGFKGLFS